VLLALLPAFGWLMGSALGADPLGVLVGTPLGLSCLVVGLLLETAGLLWTARITRGAEPP
jgi:tight adherence protein B